MDPFFTSELVFGWIVAVASFETLVFVLQSNLCTSPSAYKGIL